LAAAEAALVLSKKPELRSGAVAADILLGASPEAEPLGHHPQTETQFPLALPDVVSNFAAFKCREQGIGDAPPSQRLPFLQLMDFAA
jgi:hypothetical protein